MDRVSPVRSAHIRTYPHISSTSHVLTQVKLPQFAASSRGTKPLIGSNGRLAAVPPERAKMMLTARVTFGLSGLLLVNVVLLAVQMALGVNYLPI
ncbi:MAG: hypothetical protein ACJ8E7_00725 [Sphingomicrobium sp.]